jgi:hypothetical protein
MRPVETSRNLGRGRQRRMMEVVNLHMIYIVDCMNFVKGHNVPIEQQLKKIVLMPVILGTQSQRSGE